MANTDEIKIIVKNGSIRYIYSDDFIPLMKQGYSTTQRVSHVEPIENGWQADLSPVNGPILGPFVMRNDALTAEVNWLKIHNIPIPNGEY